MEVQSEVKPEEVVASQPDKHHKKEKGEHHEKRAPRPLHKNEHEYNADAIDETTVIPALPKKGELIPKPDINLCKEKQQKNNKRIEEIINKKKEIRAEKFKFSRNKANGEGDNVFSAFNSEISEVQQLREKLAELKVERNQLGDELHNAIDKAKINNEKLKEYRGALKGSRENFNERLEELEHIQMTKQLNKNEEKEINNEIMIIKRNIKAAESSGNIEIRLEQAEDLKDELDEQIDRIKKEKDPIDKEYLVVRDNLDKKNELITGLKTEMAAEKNVKTEEKDRHDVEYENWKEEKKTRLDQLEEEINKVREQNNKLWDDYHKKQDDHWKQKHFVDWIEWQIRVKSRKVADKEKEARKADYEKRDKEREKEAQLQKFLGEIELINFLVTYLVNLKGGDSKVQEEKKEVKLTSEEISSKVSGDAQWKKEKVEILKSKKSAEDEEPEKKHKKTKKKKEETVKAEQKFLIPFNVQTMFESIRLLAPASAQEIDAKINQLKQLEALFTRVAQEESNEEEKKLAEEIKAKNSGKPSKGQHKPKKPEGEDFPTI